MEPEMPRPMGATSGEFCPQSEQDWQDWRDQEIEVLFRSSYQKNGKHIGEVFDECKDHLRDFPRVDACTKNLQIFSRKRFLEKQEGHTLGLEISDHDYFNSVPDAAFFELPGILKSQDFLGALDLDENGVGRAIEILNDYNKNANPEKLTIKFVPFESASLVSPDDSESRKRLLVVVSHRDFLQFVQFAIRDDVTKPLAQSVSMIVVQKSDLITHQELARPRAYFNDLYRVRSSGGIAFSTRLKENKNTLEDCGSCHKAAVLPIHPQKSSFDEKIYGSNLAEINGIISHYGRAEAVHFVPERDGPALGEGDPTRITDEFLRACAGDKITEKKSYERIKSAMNCSSCHNSQSRGGLALSSISANQLPVGGNLISRYVVDLKLMPPQAELSDDERRALVSCLTADYSAAATARRGLLENWLLQPECKF